MKTLIAALLVLTCATAFAGQRNGMRYTIDSEGNQYSEHTVGNMTYINGSNGYIGSTHHIGNMDYHQGSNIYTGNTYSATTQNAPFKRYSIFDD